MGNDWKPAFRGIILLLCTLLLIPSPLYSQVEVDPGRPDSFEVNAPSSAQAGVEFQVTIRVLDSEGNLVEQYNQLDRRIEISTTGEGTPSIREIRSDQFSNGTLTIAQEYNRAEEMVLSVREANHVASGRSNDITVRPGPPESFSVSTPQTARAGTPFSLELIARDEFGNRVRNYRETTNGILLRTDGVENVDPSFVSVDQFNDGRLQTNLSYTVAETIRLNVVDEVNRIRVASDTVNVQPASLNEFTVSVPGQARAGEPFKAAVEAKDQYGNIVTNYPEKGQGVDLRAMDGGEIEPSYLPPSRFTGGVAFTELSYTRAGPLRIRVQDRGSSAEGTSERLDIRAGETAGFNVLVPDEVEAGEDFDVRLEAVDRYGNRVRRYNEVGQTAVVSIRGENQTLTTVSPQQFEEGEATATIRQTVTGNVRVHVRAEGDSSLQGQSDQIVVVPSEPGQLAISSPSSVTAGQNFTVTVSLQDEYGNLIRNTGDLAGTVHANILDHGGGTEQTFDASQFIDGKQELTFRHTRSEQISIFTEYREYDIRSRGDVIDVAPAEFDHFAVRTPGQVTAGQSFSIGLQMRDQFGNALRSMPEDLAPLHLFTTGSDNLEPVRVTRDQIRVPNFTVSARYFIAESMAVEIRDAAGNEVGVSPPIRVSPARLASFQIDVPNQVKTTQSFPLRLEARDTYGNVISNLNEREGSVAIATSGSGNISPRVVPYNEFVNGIAEMSMTYREAEQIRLQIRGNGTESQSTEIAVEPGPPSQFEVAMQERVQAGVPFPAVIRVYDEHDNRVMDLPDDFHGVRVQTDGTARISPRRVSSSLFEQGKAEVYFGYPKTGAVSVSARALSSSIETPHVERYFVERDLQTARVHILSSHRVPATLETTPESGRLQVFLQPAELASERPALTYDDWFLKRISQRQLRFKPLPNVLLSVYPQEPVESETNFNQNLFTLELSATGSGNGPSLSDIRSLIDQGNYDEAAQQLEQYIEEHPDDQQATQLRLRLERVEELMNP